MNPGLYQSIFNSKKLLPNLKIISIGDILIHSGDVICSDPFLSEHGCVDKLELLKGNYRLKLCIANLKHWGKRVSHAALLFSENEVVTWQKK